MSFRLVAFVLVMWRIFMFLEVTYKLLLGFETTFKIFILTLAFALPIGLIVSFGSMSHFKPLKWLVRVFIWVIRGTPLMLQLIIIYYGPGLLGTWAARMISEGANSVFFTWLSEWKVFDRFLAVMIAFVINYSCYFSEIFRGGIESISKGQHEAGQVLGMTKTQVFFKVILLQVIKRIVAPMSNEIITLVKDTSLARIVMVYEIIWSAQKFIKSDGLIWPLFYSGAFYLIFCALLTLLFGYIEKKLDYYRT